MSKLAITTLTIGETYSQIWNEYFREDWETYAQRHGYDLVVFDTPLCEDPHNRPPHWQKLLICTHPSLAGYDRVAWVDSDIGIQPEKAPCLFENVPPEKVGIALHGELQDPLYKEIAMERWISTFSKLHGKDFSSFWDDYFKRADLPLPGEPRYNTGVLALSPRHHGKLLESVFEKYTKGAFDHEQTFLNYELIQAGLVHEIDPRFNREAGAEILKHYPFLFLLDDERTAIGAFEAFDKLAGACLKTIWERSWFLHFSGATWLQALWSIHVREDKNTDWRKTLGEILG